MSQLKKCLRVSNQVKRGYEKIRKMIEHAPILTKEECVHLMKDRYKEFLGKSGNRKLIKENPAVYKSILHYGHEYDRFLKSSKPFSLYLIICGQYHYNIPTECFCKECKQKLNWRPALQKIITDWVCFDCFPSPASKEYFKLKYKDKWEEKFNQYISDENRQRAWAENGRCLVQKKLERKITTFINKGERESEILDYIEKKENIKIERNFKIAGFYPDGFCKETNTIYEVYEPFHRHQKAKDDIRRLIIQGRLKCKFFIIHDDLKSKIEDLRKDAYEYVPNINFDKITTKNGLKNFAGILKQTKECVSIHTNTASLTASHNHNILCGCGYKSMKDISLDDKIEVNGVLENVERLVFEGVKDVYDVVDVESEHNYITNDIVSHNCHFIENNESSINEELYERLKASVKDPLYVMDNGCYKVFEEPQPNRIYVAGVDVSEGVGHDHSAINIFDLTNLLEIKQVAVYNNNKIPPAIFTKKVDEILTQWGKPLACIERNNQGAQVIDNLRNIYNYENIVCWGASEAGRAKSQLGIISHTNTKGIGVSNMRYWVNTLRSVEIRDSSLLVELKNFIRYPNGTWAAKRGANIHDDLVMSMVWSLIVLEESLVQRHFEVVKYDDNKKPLEIKPLDYGIKYNVLPSTMYNENESFGGGMPAILNTYENYGDEVSTLQQQGWKFLQ